MFQLVRVSREFGTRPLEAYGHRRLEARRQFEPFKNRALFIVDGHSAM